MKRGKVTTFGSLLFLIFVVACGPRSTDLGSQGSDISSPSPSVDPVQFPMTITDSLGHQLTLQKPAAIGCLWYGCIEDMADMGLVPKAAGVSKSEMSSHYLFPVSPPEHRVNNTDSVEEWAKAGVDVIITASERPESEALNSAAPVFHYYFPLIDDPNADYNGIEALKENIRLLGQMTGEPAAAEDAVSRYDHFIQAIAAAAPPEAADRRIALLYATDDGTYLMPSEEQVVILCDSISAAGLGQCTDLTASGQINAENFLAQDPDWIVYSGGDYHDRTDPVWNLLSAVKNGHVYNTDNWEEGESLRIIEHALQELAYKSLGPDSGIPDPGPFFSFDSASSPLAKGTAQG